MRASQLLLVLLGVTAVWLMNSSLSSPGDEPLSTNVALPSSYDKSNSAINDVAVDVSLIPSSIVDKYGTTEGLYESKNQLIASAARMSEEWLDSPAPNDIDLMRSQVDVVQACLFASVNVSDLIIRHMSQVDFCRKNGDRLTKWLSSQLHELALKGTSLDKVAFLIDFEQQITSDLSLLSSERKISAFKRSEEVIYSDDVLEAYELIKNHKALLLTLGWSADVLNAQLYESSKKVSVRFGIVPDAEGLL